MTLPANPVNRLVEKVKFNVGRSGDPTLDDYVIEYVNNAQKKVLNKSNFWFMHTTTTITFNQGDTQQPTPSDFKDEDIVSIFKDNQWSELDYVSWEDVRKDMQTLTQGQPQQWLIEQNNLILWPIPDQTYTVQFDYWRFLDDLAIDGDTNLMLTNYPEILESWATAKAFMKLREFEDAKEWMGMFEMQLRELVVANVDRELPDEMVIRPRSDVYGSGIRKNRGRL